MRGQVHVSLLTDFPAAFRRRTSFLLGEQFRPIAVSMTRLQGKEGAVLGIAGYENRDAAETLRGEFLYIAAAEAIRPGGHLFIHEVVGMAVRTSAGEALGTVTEVIRTGANDVYVVRGPRGEILVPAIRACVRRIERTRRRITIDPLDGMISEDQTRGGRGG